MPFDVASWWANSGHNVMSLSQLSVTYLDQLLTASGGLTTRNSTLCPTASALLPLSSFDNLEPLLTWMSETKPPNALAINTSVWDPATLDVGLSDLAAFQAQFFPSALQNATVGQVADWWTDAVQSDSSNVTNFVVDVVQTCGGYYCQLSQMEIGNPDIIGIGMVYCTTSLIILAILYSILSFGSVNMFIRDRHPFAPKTILHRLGNRILGAFIGSIDGLLEAVIVFGLAVLVSTAVFRRRTDSRFDALMADGLSLLCSTTVIMLVATYFDFCKEKPHWNFTALVVVVLTMGLFGSHFAVVLSRASALELACGIGQGPAWVTGSPLAGDPFDFHGMNAIVIGFACWTVTLAGVLAHQPALRRWFEPAWPGVGRVVYRAVESLPMLFGSVALVIYAVYFWNARQLMKKTYGEGYTEAEQTWGFGQLLALFTWLPPLMIFLHALCAGLDKMLLAKLPRGWVAHFNRGDRQEVQDGQQAAEPAQAQTQTAEKGPSMFARLRTARSAPVPNLQDGAVVGVTQAWPTQGTWESVSSYGIKPSAGPYDSVTEGGRE